MQTNLPSHLITETFIIKDLVLMGITSMLNVNINDTLTLMTSIDNRLNQNKLTYSEISFQVYSSYLMYLKYLPILDYNQYEKYKRT